MYSRIHVRKSKISIFLKFYSSSMYSRTARNQRSQDHSESCSCSENDPKLSRVGFRSRAASLCAFRSSNRLMYTRVFRNLMACRKIPKSRYVQKQHICKSVRVLEYPKGRKTVMGNDLSFHLSPSIFQMIRVRPHTSSNS